MNGARIGNSPAILVQMPEDCGSRMIAAMRERLAAIPTLYKSPSACSERVDELSLAIEMCQCIAVTVELNAQDA